jgi:hypothetical protein
MYTMAQVLDGNPVVLANVPADRCRQCGHDIISSETAMRIEQSLKTRAPSVVQVPVYDMAPSLDQHDPELPKDGAPPISANA